MTATPSIWQPHYTLTSVIARGLMEIEAARAVVATTTLPPAVEAALQQRARLRSTHYSTRIEGNRLTLAQAEQVVASRKAAFHGRERDVSEVRNYWHALLRVEEWAAKKEPVTEELLRRLHALVEKGARARPSVYRDGQNVIRDSASNAIVYLPPLANDVPRLMAGLVAWLKGAEKAQVPVPIVAGLAHYQFVTIHPYYDGNGRTARLLATFILCRADYGLNGFFSLEEHHARDLEAYYHSLAIHPHHNYYEGRAQADVTPWLEYFVTSVATVFQTVKTETMQCVRKGTVVEPDAVRKLDRRARRILALFSQQDRITTSEVAGVLGLSDRMARLLMQTWVKAGWLVVMQASNRARAYGLAESYRHIIGNVSAK
ncbi:MAG: Fic family protein [bacterium]|nr:Fic family protein [bacterium]